MHVRGARVPSTAIRAMPGRGKGRRHAARRRRGAAAVEFAVITPLVILLVIGLIEVGRAVMVAQVVVNASREGARKAALTSMTVSEVTTWTSNYLVTAGIPTSASTVTVEAQSSPGGPYAPVSNLSTVTPGNGVRVTVAVNFGQASWVAPFFMPSGSTITTATEMRKEAS